MMSPAVGSACTPLKMSSICLTSLDVLDILVDVSSFVDFLRGTAFSGDCDLGLGELCFSGDFDLRFLFGDFFPASSSENFICKEEMFGCKIVFFGLCKHGLFQGLTMDRGDISMHINELLYLLFCTFYFPAKNE